MTVDAEADALFLFSTSGRGYVLQSIGIWRSNMQESSTECRDET